MAMRACLRACQHETRLTHTEDAHAQTDKQTDKQANKQTIRALRLSFLRIFTRLGSAGTTVSFWRDLLLRFARARARIFFLLLLSLDLLQLLHAFLVLPFHLSSRVFVFTRNYFPSRVFPPFFFFFFFFLSFLVWLDQRLRHGSSNAEARFETTRRGEKEGKKAGSRTRYAIRLSYYVNALIGLGKWRVRRDCCLSLFSQ
ncbi:hypothetical protein K0M31_000314 [Melipona bicolor]|uniref:Transmembrane protein n=1 Tax=Melipona bicolor TaxID=60889 RepID=A0AA40GDI4_9HYME|nr:hypothetical protein K0M31_000314 [Melipona bicolor]